MKKSILKKIAIVVALALTITAVPSNNEIKAATKSPVFNVTKKTIYGKGKTYNLYIKNKPKKASYKWYSSKKSIATVTSKGTITAKKKGKTDIKCMIKYPNKKVKTLTCSITVKVPSKEIRISNEVLNSAGVHEIKVGESYDFNKSFTPADSSDNAYWELKTAKIDEDDVEEVVATVDKNGVVTGLKEGKTAILTVTGASSLKNSKKSKVNDAIIISIVGKSADVKSVTASNGNKVTVTFDSAIDVDTIMDSAKKVKNVALSIMTDDKGKMAQEPGELTGEMSADKKILTITAANTLNGKYLFKINSNVKTIDGIPMGEYIKEFNIYDTDVPYLIGTSNDNSGNMARLEFSEAIDKSGLKVWAAKSTNTSNKIDKLTESILTNSMNYVLSSDKKVLTIDLSGIAEEDKEKTFVVQLGGITDLSGNATREYPLSVVMKIDTRPRAQSKIVNVTRTSPTEISALFNQSIEIPGELIISETGTQLLGAIDAKNDRIVHYKLTDKEANLSGTQELYFSGFSGYRVITGLGSEIRKMNFAVIKVPPKLVNSEYLALNPADNTTNNLLLQFDRDVLVKNYTGSVTAKVTLPNGDVIPGCNIKYTVSSNDGNNVTLLLDKEGLNRVGAYEMRIPAGIVTDVYGNPNVLLTITINNTEGSGTKLPAPSKMEQLANNASMVYITIPAKLDPATVMQTTNYIFNGGPIVEKAELAANTLTTSTIALTIKSETIQYDNQPYPFKMKGIKGYGGSYAAMDDYSNIITLKENVAPKYVSSEVSGTTIKLTFDEEIKGKADFTVKKNNVTIPVKTQVISGTDVIITLGQAVAIDGNPIIVTPNFYNNIEDKNGTKAKISTIVVR